MATVPASYPGPKGRFFPSKRSQKKAVLPNTSAFGRYTLLALLLSLSPLTFAQANPQITGVDPASGKVNDSISVAGTNLGKSNVSGIFLSDDKDDFKATVVEQSDEKIVMKVPQVKSGVYNVSIQVGNKLLIKPVRFTVEE